MFCHAAPGAGSFDPDPEVTAARGIRLIGVDRPGYGGSDPVPDDRWSTVGGAADDIAEVLAALGHRSVGVAGWSAGGRVALALAARHPELVERVVVIATPAPDEEVGWVPPEQRAGLEALRGLPPEQVHVALRGQLAQLVPEEPAQAVGQVSRGLADEAVLAEPEVRRRVTDMLAAAFAQGATGIAADIAGYCLQPWGFEPAQVAAKTVLLYGGGDQVTGPRHGAWYKKRLPAARVEVSPDAGHLIVVPRWDRALSHFAPYRSR